MRTCKGHDTSKGHVGCDEDLTGEPPRTLRCKPCSTRQRAHRLYERRKAAEYGKKPERVQRP